MRITKLHHACVTITDGDSVVLVDPGEFAPVSVDGVDAVLVTHRHPDHLDPKVIAGALAQGIPVWLPADAAEDFLPNEGVHVAEPGDEFTVGQLPIRVCGDRHAELHPEIAAPLNRGYIVGDGVLITGDEHIDPPTPVRVLITPINAPWLRSVDLIRYVRKVRPALVLGVHDGLLNRTGRGIAASITGWLEREGARKARLLDDGEVLDIG